MSRSSPRTSRRPWACLTTRSSRPQSRSTGSWMRCCSREDDRALPVELCDTVEHTLRTSAAASTRRRWPRSPASPRTGRRASSTTSRSPRTCKTARDVVQRSMSAHCAGAHADVATQHPSSTRRACPLRSGVQRARGRRDARRVAGDQRAQHLCATASMRGETPDEPRAACFPSTEKSRVGLRCCSSSLAIRLRRGSPWAVRAGPAGPSRAHGKGVAQMLRTLAALGPLGPCSSSYSTFAPSSSDL